MKQIDSGLSKELQQFILNGGIINCKHLHEGSCLYSGIKRILETIPRAYKYYIPIHLIPFLIYKRKKILQNPKKTIPLALWNYIKSVLYISIYVGICKYVVCKMKDIRQSIDGWHVSVGASLACISMFLESEGRRQEIALFTLPKSLETAWRLLEKRGLVKNIPGWELILFGLAMAILNYYYHHDEEAIKPTYRKLYSYIWGQD